MTEVSEDNGKKQPIQRLLRRNDSQEYFTGSAWTKAIENCHQTA
jgi:hypothetical protein